MTRSELVAEAVELAVAMTTLAREEDAAGAIALAKQHTNKVQLMALAGATYLLAHTATPEAIQETALEVQTRLGG